MKKIIFVASFIFSTCVLYAQKPVEGDNMLTIATSKGSSPNASLIYRNYYKENTARRFTLGWNYSSTSNSYINYETYEQQKVNNNQRNMSFSASYGIQKSIPCPIERLEPYIGGDIVINYNYQNTYFKSTVTDTVSNYTGDKPGDYSLTQNYTHSAGVTLRPVLGANYYFGTKLAVGLEYQIPIAGCTYTFHSKDTDVSLYGTNLTSGTYTPKTWSANSSFTGTLLFTASYKF